MSSLLQGGLSALASGTIAQAVFVMLDVANPGRVLQATAGAETCGISARWGDTFPVDGVAAAPHAIAGQMVTYYPPPCECQITLGTGGCAVGDHLKSDANGNGITTTTSGDKYGAIAQQPGNAGDIVQAIGVRGVLH